MVKLIIFFRKPADDAEIDSFEEHFSFRHVPLIGAMPGVVRSAVSRAIGAPRGEAPYHIIHDVYFADMAALNFALNSAEGRAAGADLSTFARDIASLMFAEVWGEDPFEMGLIGHEPAPVEEAEAEIEAPVATVAAVAATEVINSAETTQPEAVVEANAVTLAEVTDSAPRDLMAELEKDLAPYRKAPLVPVDVSFLEQPREQPTPESVAVAEAQLPVANSELSDATTTPTDTPAPDPQRPPKPSLGETLA